MRHRLTAICTALAILCSCGDKQHDPPHKPDPALSAPEISGTGRSGRVIEDTIAENPVGQSTPTFESDSASGRVSTRKRTIVFPMIRQFPVISDSVAFIGGLIDSFDLDCARHPIMGRITCYRKINIYGSKTPVVLLEYNYEDGSGACYPWKNQFLFRPDGRLMAILGAERYWMEPIFPNQKPFLMALYVTYHGNGGHRIMRVRGDSIANIYPYWDEDDWVQTYGDDGDWRYVPTELRYRVRDVNHDGHNDIEFNGKFQFNPLNNNLGDDGGICTIPLHYVFLYHPKIGRFVALRDYSTELDSARSRKTDRYIHSLAQQ